MDRFAVRCPAPEVFEMLRALALKAGYTGNTTRTSGWFYIGVSGGIECGEGNAVRSQGGAKLEEISIEAAIDELTKPREKPLMVGAHKVTINPDRSVTVGCTNVPAEVCDEIEKRRGASIVYYGEPGNLRRATPGKEYVDIFWQHTGWKVDGNTAERMRTVHAEFVITEAEARQRFPEAFKE